MILHFNGPPYGDGQFYHPRAALLAEYAQNRKIALLLCGPTLWWAVPLHGVYPNLACGVACFTVAQALIACVGEVDRLKQYKFLFLPEVCDPSPEQCPTAGDPPAGPLAPCPCCGCLTIPNGGDALAFICPVCLWEIDCFITTEDDPSDQNHGLSLVEARQKYARYGAVLPRLRRYARAPADAEQPGVREKICAWGCSGDLPHPCRRPHRGFTQLRGERFLVQPSGVPGMGLDFAPERWRRRGGSVQPTAEQHQPSDQEDEISQCWVRLSTRGLFSPEASWEVS